MQRPSIQAGNNVIGERDDAIFDTENDLRTVFAKICHGDLYVIGNLWVQALRTVLVGANLSLIPVIHAAPKEETAPQKPPPMKYKDLPIYQSPHFEYKDYVESKEKCPNADVKILHTFLYPKVKNYRKSWVDSYAELKREVGEMRDDARACIDKKKKEFKDYMRCPDNMLVRQAVVAAGAATGYYIGSGRGLPRRIFFTTLGALAAGALCFPKETDEIVRDMSHRLGKFALTVYNKTCGQNITLRERLPCADDLPPPPPQRSPDKTNKCSYAKPGAAQQPPPAAAKAPPPPAAKAAAAVAPPAVAAPPPVVEAPPPPPPPAPPTETLDEDEEGPE